jgi:hypothetical protein
VITNTSGANNSLTLQLNAGADSVEMSDATEQFAASSITGVNMTIDATPVLRVLRDRALKRPATLILSLTRQAAIVTR